MGKKQKTRVHSRYDSLPEDIRELIDDRLRDPAITYLEIAEEVEAKGYAISRSSIGRLAIARNNRNQALNMRLAIAREQAKVASSYSNGDTTAYAKGVLNIVMTEITNRILSASSEEYDVMGMEKVLEATSRIIRDMTSLAKFEFSFDKGKGVALKEFEGLLDKYMADNPELREQILEKVSATMENDV